MNSPKSKFCKCCNKNLSVNSWEGHVQGKKHLKQATLYKFHDDRASRSVCVFGLKQGTSEHELADYFMQFGPVAKVFIAETGIFAIVEFGVMMAVETTLSQYEHYLGHQRLTVKRKRVKIPKFTTKVPVELPTHSLLLNDHFVHLKLAANVEAQLYSLFSRVAVSEKDMKDRLELCQILENFMQDFFPKCKVIPFGSSINGLGITGCDLDIYLDLDPCRNDKMFQDIVPREMSFNQIKNKLDYVRELGDLHFLKRLQLLEDNRLVVVIGRVLQRYMKECQRVVVIPQARCPLVNFFHSTFAINCDIQTRNRLGIHNSILLRELQQLDHRVRPILFTVRLWAKSHYLCDSKQGRFSSYAIALMAVFYLQNCRPPVLPSVHTLQQLADTKTTFNSWTTSFCMDPTRVPKSKNQDDLENLLQGFFNFCVKLDYSSNVLSLLTGQCIQKSDFLIEMEKNKAISSFRMSKINVQDPFELNRNITTGVGDVGVIMWMEALDQACKLIDSPHWTDQRNPTWGISALLTNKISQEERLQTVQQQIKMEQRMKKAYTVTTAESSSPTAKGVKLEVLGVVDSNDNEEDDPLPGEPIVASDRAPMALVGFDSLKSHQILLDGCLPALTFPANPNEELLLMRGVVRDIMETALKFKCAEPVEPDIATGDSDSTRQTTPRKTFRSSHDTSESSPRKYMKLADGTHSPSQSPSSCGSSKNPTSKDDASDLRQFVFEGSSAVYKQRKSARCHVPLNKCMSNTLTLESSASEYLLAKDKSDGDVVFKFACDVHRIGSPSSHSNESKYLLRLQNLIPSLKEFDGPFYQFLQSYVPKFVKLVIQDRWKEGKWVRTDVSQ